MYLFGLSLSQGCKWLRHSRKCIATECEFNAQLLEQLNDIRTFADFAVLAQASVPISLLHHAWRGNCKRTFSR
jgi:hypothetical protein